MKSNEYPNDTPWGQVQDASRFAEGIYMVYTASHGGIWLSPERRKQMKYKPSPWLKSAAWWEEDSDWEIPLLFFAEDIIRENPKYEKAINEIRERRAK